MIELDDPLLPTVVRAWYLLDCAGLTEREKGQVLASTQNEYDYDRINMASRAQLERKHLQQDYGGSGQHHRRRKAYMATGGSEEHDYG